MTIKKLAVKYGTDTRSIDYWSNLGLVHFTQESNGYRDYGPEAEEDMKKIMIVRAMNVKNGEFTKYYKLIDQLSDPIFGALVIDKIEDEMKKKIESYKEAIKFAKELCKNA